nr:hypothetical protein GCM10025699_32030 [Microbacterium flavescens]
MQQEVAGEDRGGVSEDGRARGIRSLQTSPIAELARDVRDAAPLDVVIDHVVVHHERGVQQLERGGHRIQAGRRGGITVESGEGCRHQGGTEPLAASCSPRERFAQGAEAGTQALRAQDDAVERGVDRRVDAGIGESVIMMRVVAGPRCRRDAAARPAGRATG